MYEDRTQNYDPEIPEEYLIHDTPFLMPPPQIVRSVSLWPWSLTLTVKKFSAMATLMTNTFAEFQWNPSTKYRDMASRGIDVNGQQTDGRMDGRTDRQLDNISLSPPVVDCGV